MRVETNRRWWIVLGEPQVSEVELALGADTRVEFGQVEMGSAGSGRKGRQPLLAYPALCCVRRGGSCYPTWIVLTDVTRSFNRFGFLEFCSRMAANSRNEVRMEVKHYV